MHYIRLLRSPKVDSAKRRLEVLFTITTDLGESFLTPDEPVELSVTIQTPDGQALRGGTEKVIWMSGMRALRATLAIPSRLLLDSLEYDVQVSIKPTIGNLSADTLEKTLGSSRTGPAGTPLSTGTILPARVSAHPKSSKDGVVQRSLFVGTGKGEHDFFDIEEDLGESIARHLWDAGVFTTLFLGQLTEFPESTLSLGPCIRTVAPLLKGPGNLNILELGCGVGVFGIGITQVISKTREVSVTDCNVLLTDVKEAEERATGNIERLKERYRNGDSLAVLPQLTYENLDWEDGMEGRLGPQVLSRRWDIIIVSDCTYNVDMLPALVGTLSAVHTTNTAQAVGGASFTTKVFLATKPRHPSERKLLEIMGSNGWSLLESQVETVPVLGGEPESIELYLYEKQ